MNIQELRLGNAVSVKVGEDYLPFTVTEIGSDVLWVPNSDGNESVIIPCSIVDSIPINKDTVKKLQYLKYVEGMDIFQFRIDELGMSIETDGNKVYMDIDAKNDLFIKSLKNITKVHQLQNLIYDLTDGVMLRYDTNV